MLASGLKLYRLHFPTILGLVLVIALPCQLLLNYLTYHVFSKEDVISAFEAGLLLDGVFGIVVTGGILHALFVQKLERRAGFLECLSTGISNWLRLAWTNALVISLIFLGLCAFVLPGLIVAIRLSLANTVVITEGEWGLDALKRSVQLTADKSWPVFRLGFLLYLPLHLLGWLGVEMLLTVPALDHWLISTALGTVLALAAGLIPVCFFLLYDAFVSEESREV